MYYDYDKDGYPDEFNSKCLCEEKDGYIKIDYTKGFDCYDNGRFAEFFNPGAKWFEASSMADSVILGSEEIIYVGCNLFKNINTPFIKTSNGFN